MVQSKIPLRDILDGLNQSDPTAEMSLRDMVDAMRRHLGMEGAFVSEFVGDTRILRIVSTETPGGAEEGRRDPLRDTLCLAVLRGELPPYMADISTHSAAGRFPAVRQLSVAAFIEAPIVLPDDSLYGTFCCYGSRPDRTLSERDLALMHVVADILGTRIWRRRTADAEGAAFRSQLGETLASGAISFRWQPIVSSKDRALHGREILARFSHFDGKGPGEVLGLSRRHTPDLNFDLEVLRRAVAAAAVRGDAEELFFVNVWPDLLLEPAAWQVFDQAPHQLVLEFCECESSVDEAVLKEAAGRVRSAGHLVALDDVGIGLSNLARLVDVRPDYIKLDRTLVSGIDTDPGRRALIAGLVGFSEAIGALVVAEGVEREEEWRVVTEVGAPLAQGFYFGAPEAQDPTARLRAGR